MRFMARVELMINDCAFLHVFLHIFGNIKFKLDLVFNNVKPKDWYFVLD